MIRRFFCQLKKLILICLSFVVFNANADLIIKNGETLTLNSTTSEILSIEGNLVIESGGTLQGASNTEIRVSGNWDNSAGGNYTHGNSKVFFTGSGVSSIKGNNHFHHLVVNKKDAASSQEYTGSEIQIESGSTQTISSQLILNGVSTDNRLKIRSTINGESHTLNASNAVHVEAWFLDIDDSIFLGVIDMPMDLDSTSIVGPIVGSGNNQGWISNSPPTISLSVNSFTEDSLALVAATTEAGSYEVGDVDNDELTVVFTSGTNPNNHYILDTSVKKILLTQAAIDRINLGNSLDEISLTVSDESVSVSDSGTPAVIAVNDAPSFTSDAPTSVSEDDFYSYTVTATDEDNNLLAYSSSDLPDWLSFDAATNTLSGTPRNQHVGDHPVVLSVSDGTETVSQAFTIAVANTNDAPSFTSDAIPQATEDLPYSYAVTAIDEDNNPLTYSAPEIPSWLSFDGATNTLSGTPRNQHVGDHPVVLSVSDGTETVSQAFTIAVANTNDAPSFTSDAPTSVSEDDFYSYTVTATDEDNNLLAYSSSDLPDWLSFDAVTNTLSGTPLNQHVSDHNVRITVNDGTVSVEQAFTITVANINDAPSFSSDAPTSAFEDNLYSYVVEAADEDNNPLTYSAPDLPDWLSFDAATNTLSGTPLNQHVSDHNVRITVNDGTVSVEQAFTITVANTNDAPSFSSDAPTSASEDNLYSYVVEAADEDNNPLTYSALDLPDWLSFDAATNTLSGTPRNQHVGDHPVVLSVSDGTETVSQAFTIAVANTNDAPSFTSDAPTSAFEDDLYSYVVEVADMDATDTVSLTATTLPDWLSFDGATNTLSGTPRNQHVGNHSVVISVSDGTETVSQAFTIAVANTNDVPSFTSDAIPQATEDLPYSYAVTAIDEDNNPLNYSAPEIPSWLSFDGATNTLSGTPRNQHVGDHPVVLSISDGTEAVSQAFTIAVANTNDAPSFSSDAPTSASEDNLYSYVVEAADMDTTDTVSFTATTLPDWLGFDAVTNTLSGTPRNQHVGNHSAVISVSDGTETVSQAFTIAVANTNDPPSFSSDAPTSASEDNLYSYVVEAADEDNNPLTYSAPDLPDWLSFDAVTNTLSGTPHNQHVGDHPVVLSISDGTEAVFQSFTIIVANTNDAPSISGSANLSVLQDQLYRFVPKSFDIDKNDRLTFTIINKPPWATFDVSNGELKGIPNNNYVGEYPNIVISVTDHNIETPISLSSFSIRVTNINDSPIIDSIANQLASENNLFEYSVNASDEDSSFNLSYSLLEKPLGMIIDSISGYISWIPGDSVATGDVQVTVQVDDGSGANNATASRSFSISVTAENDLPVGAVVISGIVAQGQTLRATNNLTQADTIKAVSVVASYIDTQGTEESVISNTSIQLLNLALEQLARDTINNNVALYLAAGIANITNENISSINTALLKQGVSSQSQVQLLVDSYIVILDFAANNIANAISPLVEDFRNIGITGISQNTNVLSLLRDIINLGESSDIDTVDKIQSLSDAVLALINYAENTTDYLTKTQLDLLGLEAVTEDNLSTILQAINETNQPLNQLAIIQLLVDKVVASNIIQAYRADQINFSAPTLDTYLTLNLKNINSSNIDKINNAISSLTASDIDSIEKIIVVFSADSDIDGVEDIIDLFPQDTKESRDLDADGIGDNGDNCPNIANQSQENFDLDSMGDACDPDEDNDGVLSIEDAFRFNAEYSLDSDTDGMPDAFEAIYRFDHEDAADKSIDSDGDGINNIDEFLAGTNPRINPNPGLPKLVIPNDIEVTSTGRLTDIDIGLATAIDGSNEEIQTIASSFGPFSAGRHEITWTATDAQENQSKAIQVIKVIPLVNLTPSSLIAEGGRTDISVVLSGDAADYPVEIPFTVSGSANNTNDYKINTTTDKFIIDQGRKASISVEIFSDEELENNETIEIMLNQPNNAVLGSVTQRTISIIDGNLPPQISIEVQQDQNIGRVIAVDKGNVTVTASVTDPNPQDTYQFNWQIDSKQIESVIVDDTTDNKKVLVIDPSQLQPGNFSITAKAEDNADVAAITEVKTDFRLMQVAPELSTEKDTDGDGISDADEGYADSDSDGIVDYMDNIVETNLAPVGEDSAVVLQSPVGTQIVIGKTAFFTAQSTVMVTKEQIINVINELNSDTSFIDSDKDYIYPYGLYDFEVSGAILGDSYYLVLPLEAPFVSGQVFRKYMGPQIGWQNFIENAKNSLSSAAAEDGACPEPGSHLFANGIQVGSNCVQLLIEDGGPNDLDGMANGVVTDPGGIAIYNKQGSAPSAKNSKLELDRAVITTRGDKAVVTITVADKEGSYLEGVNIVASCYQCIGVVIGDFSYQGSGVYIAEINSSVWLSNGWIEAVVSNEFGSASLAPKKLLVKFKRAGGCNIISGQSDDISLFLVLFLFTLFNYIKRRYY